MLLFIIIWLYLWGVVHYLLSDAHVSPSFKIVLADAIFWPIVIPVKFILVLLDLCAESISKGD